MCLTTRPLEFCDKVVPSSFSNSLAEFFEEELRSVLPTELQPSVPPHQITPTLLEAVRRIVVAAFMMMAGALYEEKESSSTMFFSQRKQKRI